MKQLLHKDNLTAFADTTFEKGQSALCHCCSSSSSDWPGKTWREILKEENTWKYYAVMIGDTQQIGEWSTPKEHGDCIRTYRSAGETCRLLQPMKVDGKWYLGDFCEISPGYYCKTIEEKHGPGDYCYYCGAFNGPNGEDRLGWDCCYCGCN